MKPYTKLSGAERAALYHRFREEYEEYVAMGLSLDLSRGKPSAEQLDLSQPMLEIPLTRDRILTESGIDCRNYGVPEGIPEIKKLYAGILGIREEDIMVGGNSSLQLMYDTLARAMLFGVYGSPRPWCKEEGRKWICVTPGYDRHFAITEALGFTLLSVPMTPDGPDMDAVEDLVRDPEVKGIWCVPKYSNPTGNTYSDGTVRRLAAMRCGAPDFRIIWDNAYAVHDFGGEGDVLADIFEAARAAGNEDRIFCYSSTSKITFPGGGVAVMAASENNRRQILPLLSVQTIGYDKLNQLRHVLYFRDAQHVRDHMRRLGEKIRKKFEITLSALSSLHGLGIARWTEPHGGYFISLDLLPGKAKRVYDLMRAAGVTLTAVGATYPYGIDPQDRNLRIAPTCPSDEDLALACRVLVCVIRLASLEPAESGAEI